MAANKARRLEFNRLARKENRTDSLLSFLKLSTGKPKPISTETRRHNESFHLKQT